MSFTINLDRNIKWIINMINNLIKFKLNLRLFSNVDEEFGMHDIVE